MRDVLHEVDDELGLAGELLAEFGVLRGDADRTRVEMADAHHHAARHDERRGREAELLGAQQRGDDDVAAGLQLPVDLHDDAVAQTVHEQRLLRLGETELPRRARVLERRQRRCAGAAVVSRDQHDIGVRLGDTCRDRADADLGHQLHVHTSARVGVLEVVDQLLEIFDRVDVVVRRRRDEPDARGRVPRLGDPRIDLLARQLTALARLGALRHLDLEVVGVDEVFARHAEAPGRDLLDGAAPQIAVGIGQVAVVVLAAFAGVGTTAEAVHGDGQRLVRLFRDRAVAHGAGVEPLDDVGDRLDFFDRARACDLRA